MLLDNGRSPTARIAAIKYAAAEEEEFGLPFHSLRHHPVTNGSLSGLCHEKTREICSILGQTFAPWNVASSQDRSLERRFLWRSVL
jgi:hypothetical protein